MRAADFKSSLGVLADHIREKALEDGFDRQVSFHPACGLLNERNALERIASGAALRLTAQNLFVLRKMERAAGETGQAEQDVALPEE